MFLVLRKSSIRRSFALSILLILVGYSIANPSHASAAIKQPVYLYPYATNNPVEVTGLFWAEANPEMGAYPLAAWNAILNDRLVVVGIPEHYGYVMGSSMLGDKLGKWVVYKLRQKLSTPAPKKGVKATSPPKDQFVYKRTLGDVTEEIKVDVGEHFRDNDSFDKFMDTVRKNLTNGELIKETNKKIAPAPNKNKLTLVPDAADQSDVSPETAKAVGNTLMLGGVALMLLKLLPFLIL